MTSKLSTTEARRIVIECQSLHTRQGFGKGVEASLQAIKHLGYIQLDTLSVVARAHLHTLWNRVDDFEPEHINQLLTERKIFEHWAHALAILPIEDYRFSLPMMQRISRGEIHWYAKNSKQTKRVLKRIREEGPLAARDFNDKKSSNAMWARSPSKLALEQLFMEGELMVSERVNFHKIYDLRERVLPDSVDTRLPTAAELSRHLILSFLRAQGLGQTQEMSYLRKGLGAIVRETAREMVEEGLLTPLKVADQDYLCLPQTLDMLSKKPNPAKTRILSPFDNAVIQRKRIKQLFQFDYQIECYVKKEKRKYGYFSLPILRNNKLVARLDAKADRKNSVFELLHLHLEPSLRKPESFFRSLLPELKRFAAFNACKELKMHRISGSNYTPEWG